MTRVEEVLRSWPIEDVVMVASLQPDQNIEMIDNLRVEQEARTREYLINSARKELERRELLQRAAKASEDLEEVRKETNRCEVMKMYMCYDTCFTIGCPIGLCDWHHDQLKRIEKLVAIIKKAEEA